MQKLLVSLTCALMLAAIMPSEACQAHVNGYYRSNGTYVQPHCRACRNNTANDNGSARG